MKRYFFAISLFTLVLVSCSKEEGEGGRSSISGKLEGTESQIARAEVTEVTCVPGNEIKGKDFFLINTPGSADNYFVWFNDLSNLQGAPLISNRIAVKVDYNSGSSSNISIATAVENAINMIAGSPFSVSRFNDILTITCNTKGETTDADNGISKLAVDVKTQGKDELTLRSGSMADEDVYIIYGDKDDVYDDNMKTNFDGTFKFDNLRKGSYRIFAYSEDKSSTGEPLTAVMKSIEIGGNDEGSVGTITIEKKND